MTYKGFNGKPGCLGVETDGGASQIKIFLSFYQVRFSTKIIVYADGKYDKHQGQHVIGPHCIRRTEQCI
jgi:hypothetical protein